MCFRPSALTGPNSDVQKGNCPTCGMPVEASIDTTSGTCPYCGNPIPSSANGTSPAIDPGTRIL